MRIRLPPRPKAGAGIDQQIVGNIIAQVTAQTFIHAHHPIRCESPQQIYHQQIKHHPIVFIELAWVLVAAAPNGGDSWIANDVGSESSPIIEKHAKGRKPLRSALFFHLPGILANLYREIGKRYNDGGCSNDFGNGTDRLPTHASVLSACDTISAPPTTKTGSSALLDAAIVPLFHTAVSPSRRASALLLRMSVILR